MPIEFPFFMYMTLLLSKPRFGPKITLLAAGLVTVLFMFILNDLPVGMLALTFAALLLTRQRWVHSLFIMASAYMLIMVADALSEIGFLLLDWQVLFSQLIYYLAVSPLLYLARRPITHILAQTKKGWWLLCSVPLFLIGYYILQPTGRIPAALIFCGTSFIIYITFFYMMWQLYKQNLLEQNVMALRMSVSDLEHQNELIQQSEKRYALFRHDVRHIIQMISSSLSQQDIKGAKEWLKPLMENVNTEIYYPARVFTGHPLPDAVLSRYIEQAFASGIDIKVRITGKPAVDMTELAVVLANALENAVRACLEMENEPKIIRVDGQQRGAQFFLEIANTFTGEVDIDPDSGLPIREKGLGSQSIAFFAEKHEAVLQYQIENGWFRLRLLM